MAAPSVDSEGGLTSEVSCKHEAEAPSASADMVEVVETTEKLVEKLELIARGVALAEVGINEAPTARPVPTGPVPKTSPVPATEMQEGHTTSPAERAPGADDLPKRLTLTVAEGGEQVVGKDSEVKQGGMLSALADGSVQQEPTSPASEPSAALQRPPAFPSSAHVPARPAWRSPLPLPSQLSAPMSAPPQTSAPVPLPVVSSFPGNGPTARRSVLPLPIPRPSSTPAGTHSSVTFSMPRLSASRSPLPTSQLPPGINSSCPEVLGADPQQARLVTASRSPLPVPLLRHASAVSTQHELPPAELAQPSAALCMKPGQPTGLTPGLAGQLLPHPSSASAQDADASPAGPVQNSLSTCEEPVQGIIHVPAPATASPSPVHAIIPPVYAATGTTSPEKAGFSSQPALHPSPAIDQDIVASAWSTPTLNSSTGGPEHTQTSNPAPSPCPSTVASSTDLLELASTYHAPTPAATTPPLAAPVLPSLSLPSFAPRSGHTSLLALMSDFVRSNPTPFSSVSLPTPAERHLSPIKDSNHANVPQAITPPLSFGEAVVDHVGQRVLSSNVLDHTGGELDEAEAMDVNVPRGDEEASRAAPVPSLCMGHGVVGLEMIDYGPSANGLLGEQGVNENGGHLEWDSYSDGDAREDQELHDQDEPRYESAYLTHELGVWGTRMEPSYHQNGFYSTPPEAGMATQHVLYEEDSDFEEEEDNFEEEEEHEPVEGQQFAQAFGQGSVLAGPAAGQVPARMYRCRRCGELKKGHTCPFDSAEEEGGAGGRTGGRTGVRQVEDQEWPRVLVDGDHGHAVRGNVLPGWIESGPQKIAGKSRLADSGNQNAALKACRAGRVIGAENVPEVEMEEIPQNAKALLATGALEGITVSYLDRHFNIMLTGIVRNGLIACNCKDCQGKRIPVSEFERHAGSSARHPSDNIYIANRMCLKDLINIAMETRDYRKAGKAVANAIRSPGFDSQDTCMECGEGGTLLCCDKEGCPKLYHPRCVGLDSVPKGDWLCPSCGGQTEAGKSKRAPRLLSAPPPPPAPPPPAPTPPLASAAASGRMYKRDPGLAHKALFLPGGLPDGTPLAYYVKGQRILGGTKAPVGVLCDCCGAVLSCSLFEQHAGYGSRRNPYKSIYMDDGRSLHEAAGAMVASEGGEVERGGSKGRNADNADVCVECGDGGKLVLCDGCPAAYHAECAALAHVPRGDWYCPNCRGSRRRGSGEGISQRATTKRKGGKVEAIHGRDGQTGNCRRVLSDAENLGWGCVLCRSGANDFSKLGFGPRTVMLCDQCEREFHVGCLREHGVADLKALPEGEWFCTTECEKIFHDLKVYVSRGVVAVSADWAANVSSHLGGGAPADSAPRTWQLLRGRQGDPANGRTLASIVDMFSESFDPIVDGSSGKDLIPLMVHSRSTRDHDFSGMHCVVLRHKDKPVSAACLRIFGRQVAEMPLVATALSARRHGHCRALLACVEWLLAKLRVERLCLPAAHGVEDTWLSGFGFSRMSQEDFERLRSELQMLVFPGAIALEKRIPPLSSPQEVKERLTVKIPWTFEAAGESLRRKADCAVAAWGNVNEGLDVEGNGEDTGGSKGKGSRVKGKQAGRAVAEDETGQDAFQDAGVEEALDLEKQEVSQVDMQLRTRTKSVNGPFQETVSPEGGLERKVHVKFAGMAEKVNSTGLKVGQEGGEVVVWKAQSGAKTLIDRERIVGKDGEVPSEVNTGGGPEGTLGAAEEQGKCKESGQEAAETSRKKRKVGHQGSVDEGEGPCGPPGLQTPEEAMNPVSSQRAPGRLTVRLKLRGSSSGAGTPSAGPPMRGNEQNMRDAGSGKPVGQSGVEQAVGIQKLDKLQKVHASEGQGMLFPANGGEKATGRKRRENLGKGEKEADDMDRPVDKALEPSSRDGADGEKQDLSPTVLGHSDVTGKEQHKNGEQLVTTELNAEASRGRRSRAVTNEGKQRSSKMDKEGSTKTEAASISNKVGVVVLKRGSSKRTGDKNHRLGSKEGIALDATVGPTNLSLLAGPPIQFGPVRKRKRGDRKPRTGAEQGSPAGGFCQSSLLWILPVGRAGVRGVCCSGFGQGGS